MFKSYKERSSTLFLQIVIVFIAMGSIALMLIEPHFEGRNVNSTFIQIYFKDPFLAYVYVSSIAYFTALYQAFKLLGFIGKNNVFSEHSIKALRTIKYCASTLIVCIIGAEFWLIIFQRGEDDITGGFMIGLIMTFISIIVASAAGVFEKALQNALEIKSENELIV